MQTQLLAAPDGIARAIELLRASEVVALPTETVYGLAADALSATAVAKIFEAKERPTFDPLIVHLPSRDSLGEIVDVAAEDRQLVSALIEKFWPGPLTLVLPKRTIIPDLVTAGLTTVAVRMSAHPVFTKICAAVGPLAAPSANRFGKISPTIAQHVFDELDGRIPLIVDGGATTHGIESTIIAPRAGKIDMLRRGPITREQLSMLAPAAFASGTNISAPGQSPSHYAPNKPLRLVDDARGLRDEHAGVLAWNSVDARKFALVRQLSPRHDLREAAANLFRYLRELDANEDVDLIVAERVPDQGLGAAIMDRLRRAAHPSDAPTPPR